MVRLLGTRNLLGAALLGSCLLGWACGSLKDESPTRPDPTQEPVAVAPTAQPGTNPTPAPVFGAPAPKATPTPEPTPEPSPGAPQPPPTGSGCGSPVPPPLSQVNVKVHLRVGQTWVMDSTPLVGPDAEYCYGIGFTDGRTICPVRPEDWPDRAACEHWRVGKAKDTGRYGPTWRKADGTLCTGPDSGCANHPDNQYQLFTYRSGTYTVTAENGASCTVSH